MRQLINALLLDIITTMRLLYMHCIAGEPLYVKCRRDLCKFRKIGAFLNRKDLIDMILSEFFRDNPKGAIAFSGGTDSSLLVWAASRYGRDWHAYYVKSAFQPEFELADAHKIASDCQMPLTVIEGDIMKYPEVTANPKDRCYLCKKEVFSLILHQAKAEGYSLIIDGTNASDDEADRPGTRALREMNVRSPLRECGMKKSDVREMSREAGLFTWNKPSYACLATRIPTGTQITEFDLKRIERGENILASLGFTDFRIRLHADVALLQFTSDQFAYALDRREDISRLLSPIFPIAALDMKPRVREG